MSFHPLNRPVWTTLMTRQSSFSIGGELARRFVPAVGPLAAARDNDTESLTALAELVPYNETLLLLQADPIAIPDGIEAVNTALGVQMVLERPLPLAKETATPVERLKQSDVLAMVELATLTKPGPFCMGTMNLGEFWGIKEEGVLLAMAGERMKVPGYTEVSGVCVHPKARGRGFARQLSHFVSQRIVSRGEIPFLHAYATNVAAIQLYESIGFKLRCSVSVAALSRGKGFSIQNG